MKKTSLILFLFIGILVFPQSSSAIVPPDFIVQIGSSLGVVLSSIVLAIAAIGGIVAGFFRKELAKLKKISLHKNSMWPWLFLVLLVLLVVSFVIFQKRERVYQEKIKQLEVELIWKSPGQYGRLVTIEEENPGKPTELMVTNEQFATALASGEDLFLLDAREDAEREAGYLPGSVQMRFADIFDGAWRVLPDDKPIYVLCWSSLRGKIVSDFLATKGITAYYIEGGISKWVEQGGIWEGSIYLEAIYNQKQHTILLETDEVAQALSQGVSVIDTREPERFLNWHIPGSIHTSVVGTSSEDLAKLYASVPSDKPFITVCDQFVNCFDARIAGIELEKTGRVYLGRYTKPWDYRDRYVADSY